MLCEPGIERIGDGDDHRRLWYRIAGDSRRVAAAVPLLVVVERDCGGQFKSCMTAQEAGAPDARGREYQQPVDGLEGSCVVIDVGGGDRHSGTLPG